ncbi:MAG: hypothetical protein JXQ97_17195 [Natronospirillum sp.]
MNLLRILHTAVVFILVLLLVGCNPQNRNSGSSDTSTDEPLSATERLAAGKEFAQDFQSFMEDMAIVDAGFAFDFDPESSAEDFDVEEFSKLIDSMNAVFSFLGDEIFAAAVNEQEETIELWPTIDQPITQGEISFEFLGLDITEIEYSLSSGRVLVATGEIEQHNQQTAQLIEFDLEVTLPELSDETAPYSYNVFVTKLDFRFQDGRHSISTTGSSATLTMGVPLESLMAMMAEESEDQQGGGGLEAFNEVLDGFLVNLALTNVYVKLGELVLSDAALTLNVSDVVMSEEGPTAASVFFETSGTATLYDGSALEASILLNVAYEISEGSFEPPGTAQVGLIYQLSLGTDTGDNSLWILLAGSLDMLNVIYSENDDEWCVEPVGENVEFSLALTSTLHPHAVLALDPSPITETAPRQVLIDDGDQVMDVYSVQIGRLTVQDVEEARLFLIETSDEASLVLIFNSDDEEVTLISSSQLFGEPQ